MTDTQNKIETDVAIVGGGPAGVMAAKFCGEYGLSAAVFDGAENVYDLPRAVGMWDDVQRIVADAGLMDDVLPSMCDQTGAEFVDAEGNRLSGIELPADFLTPNGHPFIRGFHQPGFEQAIRRRLADHDGVSLFIYHEAEKFSQDADGVNVVVRDLAGGGTKEVRAKWLIGCDGASSFVRRSCDISWDNIGYDQEWLVVDVTISGDVQLPPLMTQICDPARPTTVIPLPLGMHRWEFELLPGESREEMEAPDRVWSLLSRWMKPSDGKIERAVVYRFHATIASTFRDGRIFLAGDSAHQTPPFMGQGLCSGMRDVNNLVWKLAAVAGGSASDALLDTYTDERRPMAIAMVKHSVNTGKLIDAWAAMGAGGPEPSEELQAYAYGGSAQLPHLATGLLSGEDSEWIGQPIPQCDVSCASGSAMFDKAVGHRWAVVAKNDPRDSIDAESCKFWDDLDAAFVSVPEPEGAMLGLLLAHEVVVVRPDRLIYAVSDKRPDLGFSRA
jgi:3-(3-hydroxy-phenyl)propionate hydroxylase